MHMIYQNIIFTADKNIFRIINKGTRVDNLYCSRMFQLKHFFNQNVLVFLAELCKNRVNESSRKSKFGWI